MQSCGRYSDLPPGLTLVGSPVAKISSEGTQTVLARLRILSRKGKRIEVEYEEKRSIARYISQADMKTLASDNGS